MYVGMSIDVLPKSLLSQKWIQIGVAMWQGFIDVNRGRHNHTQFHCHVLVGTRQIPKLCHPQTIVPLSPNVYNSLGAYK